ncbi:MAG TPA: TRAP transporter large permease [Xanthobacteraceae bacterium]|nr:TRAP transporter large permease [Xanthobacteraceae bacterium]
MNVLLIFVLPALLLLMGVPIFVVLLAAALGGIALSGNPIHALHSAMFGSLDIFPLLAVPLFIYAGDIMSRGGIARRLIELILSLVGAVRGALGIATIAACEVFSVMSGSSVACVAAIGKLTIPALKKNGYGDTFSVSLVTATGVIDIITPPSITMIIYGIVAQQSVPHLFLAGFPAGILIGIALAIYVVAYAKKERIPITAPASRKDILVHLKDSIWSLLAPVVILGGIYGGLFTPTEAAGVACIYAIVVSMFIYRELTWKELWQITIDSSALIAQILIIVSAAGAFAWLITTSGYPAKLVVFVQDLGLTKWVLLLVINVILLFVGSILEPPAAILLLTPLLTPIVYQAGVDPIHFGIIVTVNLAIGMFMPPFGLNLFASHALFGTPLPKLYRGVLPFLVIYLLMLIVITYVPEITLAPLRLLR